MAQSHQSGIAGATRSSLLLAAASIVNGLTAYAIASIGSWAFGAVEFAPYASLWTVLTLALAAVTFPLQHWIIRTISIGGGELSVRRSFRRIAPGLAVLTFMVFFVSWIFADRLFAGSKVFAVFAGVLVVESAFVGVSRGTLVGRGHLGRAAAVMGGENLIRLVAGVIVIVAGWGIAVYGAAILSGVLIVGFFPSSIRLKPIGDGDVDRVVSILGGIAGGTLLSQIVLVSAPLVVAMRTTQLDQVTAMFATTALARAPFLVALGIGLQGTALLSRKYAANPAMMRKLAVWLAAGGAALSVLGGVAYGFLAPFIVPLLFGPDTALSVLESALVGGASLLAIVSLFTSLLLVVQERTIAITVSWVLALLVGIAVLLLVPATPSSATAVAFAAAEITALLILTASATRSDRNVVDRTPTLGNP